MRKKKVDIVNIVLVLMFLIGLSLVAYPTFADWWNKRAFNYSIDEYNVLVANVRQNELQYLLDEGKEYNEIIAERGNYFGHIDDVDLARYNKQLSITGEEMAMMGYIQIPKINVSLPIYHSTEEATLSAGVGHLAGTSLPIGGESTHSVLSSHRGLPSARLFTDLDQMIVGDYFVLEVLGTTLTYEVDQVVIVLPEEVSELKIVEGKDYCTLVTCTPYGVNTHRILVRGHRVANFEGEIPVPAEAKRISSFFVAGCMAAPVLFIMMIYVFIPHKKRRKS